MTFWIVLGAVAVVMIVASTLVVVTLVKAAAGADAQEAKLPFTGTCPVREHAGDGVYVGRCDFSTYGGECPRHGDVAEWLGEDPDLTLADDRLINRADWKRL